ncbi:hypothetical protein D3C79_1007360 [compost metagenome]
MFDEEQRQETEQSIQANLMVYLQENYHCPLITFSPYEEQDRLTKLKRIENKMAVKEVVQNAE